MGFIDVFKSKLLNFFNQKFTKRKYFLGDPNLLDEPYGISHIAVSPKIDDYLTKAAFAETTVLLSTLETNLQGLNETVVEQRQATYGLNEIQPETKMTWYKRLWICYRNPFSLLLSVLAVVSFVTADLIGSLIIGLMILIATVLRFIQESRSDEAVSKLKRMVHVTATVLRQPPDENQEEDAITVASFKKAKEIPIAKLVPGDIIFLSAGDMIPADVRLLSDKDLFVSEATLTGESVPIEKFATHTQKNSTSVLDLKNIGFMGTNVVSGTATALVLTTGKNTLFGSLATKVIHQNMVETAFQKGVNKVSWLLIYFMLIMAPIVFLINGFTKHDWLSAALFSLSIAVGLTPEMLPMIATSTLAKGAVFMSRRKVVVKRLDAIQNFGAMDILCTDKTGTLTQNKICLAKHLDILGEENDSILYFAYLNSYYQTGLKNLLDVAVLDKIQYEELPASMLALKKEDEIPFDFKRKRMSVIVTDDAHEHLLICKGAPEEVLQCCQFALHDEAISPLNATLRAQQEDIIRDLNKDGFRVVAIAIRKFHTLRKQYTISDEQELTLIGYITFLDPPKETAHDAILALKTHGIQIKILTGDNAIVTTKVCKEVGLDVSHICEGYEIEHLSDAELAPLLENTTVFAKLTPEQKERIVRVLHERGHIVGFMGDGINDAPALRSADIGISVDTAVDIAKEASDIILLEKNLTVLENGVEEGRRTFANMLKYIKITASSNFGNVFSVLIASAFLPFEPMLPLQILILNLIYDISQVAIPFDNVDAEFITSPQRWDTVALRRFMIFFGPLSSIFDMVTFVLLWNYYGANHLSAAPIFQTGWFIESLFTQMLIVHMIRTRKISFVQSVASLPMIVVMVVMLSIGLSLTIVPTFVMALKMHSMPLSYFGWVSLIILGYMGLVQSVKGWYAKRFGWQ